MVIIEKSSLEFERCVEWCDKTYGGNNRKIIIDLQSKLDNVIGLRIKQKQIDDNLENIWSYLINTPWDKKYKRLVNFNIQSDPFNVDLAAAKELIGNFQ